ncbi:hypothetical protein ACFL5O_08390, partial [Myxococcota bacterium]
ESLRLCEEMRKLRARLRHDGYRQATRTSAETPSLGMLIGRYLVFESPRRNGNGPQESMHAGGHLGAHERRRPAESDCFLP